VPTGSSSSSSSPKGSYSEFYKAVNSTQYGLGSAGQFSSNGGPSHEQRGLSPQQHLEQQQQQQMLQPSHAAAAEGHGDGNGSEQLPIDPHHTQTQQQQSARVDAADVSNAIRKAQEAIAAAESSLSSIQHLPSAQLPNPWAGLLQVAKSLATVAAAGALLVASHAFGLGWQWAGATIGALALAGKQL
jgi:hypothetical protein